MDFNCTDPYNLLHGLQPSLRLVAAATLELHCLRVHDIRPLGTMRCHLYLETYGVLTSFLWTSAGLQRGDRRLARPLNYFADLVLDIF